jgi:perosamine synthetase
MAIDERLDETMYVPAWQGLAFRNLMAPPNGNLAPFPFHAPHRAAFHTARSAIYHLFRKLVESGRTKVLVPDYHMGNEVRAIRAAGAEVELYAIGVDGRPDLDELSRRSAEADVLFTIHYAGWPQPIADLRKLCDEYGLLLVEDCAVALFSETAGRPLGSFGDYAVFCLYKTLPVIDGGLLVQNRDPFIELDRSPLRPIGKAFEVGQAAELWVERLRGHAPRLGAVLSSAKRRIGALLTALHVERVPVGDVGFRTADTQLAMSALSAYLLQRLDCTGIRPQRRRNFLMLAELLHQSGITPWRNLEPGVCPLFFPLLVKDKPAAARTLWKRGIMAIELWNEGDPLSVECEGPDATFLRRHLLELPVHQNIREEQIRYMARHVVHANVAIDPMSAFSVQRQAWESYARAVM